MWRCDCGACAICGIMRRRARTTSCSSSSPSSNLRSPFHEGSRSLRNTSTSSDKKRKLRLTTIAPRSSLIHCSTTQSCWRILALMLVTGARKVNLLVDGMYFQGGPQHGAKLSFLHAALKHRNPGRMALLIGPGTERVWIPRSTRSSLASVTVLSRTCLASWAVRTGANPQACQAKRSQ